AAFNFVELKVNFVEGFAVLLALPVSVLHVSMPAAFNFVELKVNFVEDFAVLWALLVSMLRRGVPRL
ncbi:MAG: hypothetical protein II394_07425, partial [Bacteroidales bacterium]|nr:hypothetical protein [Bacteroidales bacterium]